MKYGEFTDEQRIEFSEFFYEKLYLCGVSMVEEDEYESPNPWGGPWVWCEDSEAIGETIEDMAFNFAVKHAKEIKELMDQDEERENEDDDE